MKAYDHILCWHMVSVAKNMARDQALSLGAVGSGALEAMNKFWKRCMRQNVGAGRLDSKHATSNERLVKSFIKLSADMRCMRQRW